MSENFFSLESPKIRQNLPRIRSSELKNASGDDWLFDLGEQTLTLDDVADRVCNFFS